MPLEYFLSVQEQKCQEANNRCTAQQVKTEHMHTPESLTYVELESYLESLEPRNFKNYGREAMHG